MPEFVKYDGGHFRVIRRGLQDHPPQCATEVLIDRWCRKCQARTLVKRPLGEAEELHRTGRISQDAFEAYMHVWATSEVRWSSLGLGWQSAPHRSDVAAFADELRRALKERTTTEGAPC